MKCHYKVVWLCHVANDELNAYFNKDVPQCAYWITQFLDIMKDQGLDIHVVTPNYYTNTDDCIKIDGVTYHLFKYHSGLLSDRACVLEIALRRESNIKRKVANIIISINPDLIHLYGAENITYSSGVLPLLNKYPVLVTFQGYIQQSKVIGGLIKGIVARRRIRTEDEILRKVKHITFGEVEINSRTYYVSKYKNEDTLYLNFPTKDPSIDASMVTKEYDMVFWGRITPNKGVEDFIRGISILKKNHENIKGLILGGGSDEYLSYLQGLVKDLGVDSNIVFGGFQKTNEELFANAAKAKVYVLPTYFDALPGSVRESMLMKLPVVTYPVGDLPELNKNANCIILAKYRNIEDLAENIERLLTDIALRSELTENAYQMMSLQNNNHYIASQMMRCYKHCILNFQE